MANMFKDWFKNLFSSPLEVDTTGPKPHEEEHALPDPTVDKHLAGGDRDWYPDAHRVDANLARVGGVCTPKTIVVHTTDTMPGGFNAIVKSWSTTSGARNAAHYLIGRNAKDGIIQFVSHRRNSNHAGGNTHGNWYIDGKLVHPNSISIGIEIDAGGKLYKNIVGNWVHADTRKIVDPVDVYIDKWGNGWHRVTQYQLDQLNLLINWLILNVVQGLSTADVIYPNGSYTGNRVSPWAESNKYNFLVGHVTLDPTNKTDPGPQVMELLSKW